MLRLFSSLLTSLATHRERILLRNYRALVVFAAVCFFAIVALFSKSEHSSSGPVYDVKLCEDPDYKGNQQYVECTCANPFVEEDWYDNEGWEEQHQRMVASASTTNPLDLVFLGDSITERINGTQHLGQKLVPNNRLVFESHFSKAAGGSLEAIALGSSGDTTNNLLWHLQHGMLPDSLHPSVWFVLIGTNNLGRSGCSQQSTLDGILTVLQYLQSQRPKAKIILHGLLPRSERAMESDNDYKTGAYWSKIQWINQRLQKACSGNYVYMESNDLFLSSQDTINSVTMKDGLHPCEEGLKQWEPRIVSAVQNLLQGRNLLLHR